MNAGGNWGHMAAAFGPWHRALLVEFERELQSVDPSVTIPYWDWTSDRDATSTLWKPDFLGSNGTGNDHHVADGKFAAAGGRWRIQIKDRPTHPDFLRRNIGARADARTPPSATLQQRVITLTPYDTSPWDDMMRDPQNAAQWGGFRVGLEVALHNLVHRWVGGNMLDASSPNDPVFWLHHCNCDRLWALWQFKQQSAGLDAYAPRIGGPDGHNLNDAMIFHADGDPAPWGTAYRPLDVIDHRTLGVEYDTDPVGAPPITMRPMPVPPRPDHDERMHRTDAGVSQMRHHPPLPMFAIPSDIAALSHLQER
jgi:tyrosinase